MKENFIILMLLVLSANILACSHEKTELINNLTEERIDAQSIEFVGIEHNDMLDKTYEFLKAQSNKKNFKTTANKKQNLELFLTSLLEENDKYSESSNKMGIQNIKKYFNNPTDIIITESSVNLKESITLLSDIESSYLDSLDLILSKMDFSQNSDFEEQIINLEKNIDYNNELNDKQLITLYSATQTAKYSYRYWKENWKKWADLKTSTLPSSPNVVINENKDDSKPLDEHAKDVVKADVAGALGGASYALVANVVVGAGQVAYGSAIVGTAAAGSVISAAVKILDWIW